MHGSPSLRLWAGIVIVFASHGAFAATTLTMTTEYPATSMPGQGVSTFADLVRSKSGGQVLIDTSLDAARGIKSGEVNAVLSSGDGGAGRKLWEHLPRFAEIHYAMPISVATMNLGAYQALDANSRKAIDQAAAQTEAEQWKRIEGRLQQNYANMRKNGVTIDTAVPTPVRRALKEAAADSEKQWEAAAGADGVNILKAMRRP